MRSHIAKQLEESQLSGGNGVIVDGSFIAIQPSNTAPFEAEPETWSLRIWGKLSGVTTGNNTFEGDYEDAGTINRGSGILIPGSIWESAEYYNFTGEDGPISTREITLELQVRAFDTLSQSLSYERNYYRIPVRLTMELRAYYGPASEDYTVRDIIQATLRRPGWKRRFTANAGGALRFQLYPVSIERI